MYLVRTMREECVEDRTFIVLRQSRNIHNTDKRGSMSYHYFSQCAQKGNNVLGAGRLTKNAEVTLIDNEFVVAIFMS